MRSWLLASNKMSAESPRRGYHKGVQIISPQPISDRSIIDSVAGIINDIVPQAYTTGPNSENKESITWARFEYADLNDASLSPDYDEGSSTSPLLLVLGYTSGVQVWLVAASGEATEILSWRQSVVRILRILPNPIRTEKHPDPYDDKRPLIAICDSTGPGPQFCSVNFISLKTGEQTKSIKFKNQVCDVLANRRSIVVTFSERIAVFDARTFEDVLTVTSCYPCPGPNPNPVALGTRWLAYSEKKLIPTRRSSGGCEGEGVPSYTAAVLYAAKSLSKGLRGLGESVASSLTGNTVAPVVINTGNDVTQPGVITILDLQASKQGKQYDDTIIETMVAHFTAHSDAIVAMTFDLTGAILMTADKRGHDFHVFRIQPHPGGPSLAAVHHLYVLHRGDTTAKVQDMVFSCDTRWAAVSTVRGTTHVFPVAPYGGSVGMRTHSTPHVVNRLSRFHRSAGLTDDSPRSHSPVSHVEIPLAVYPYSNPRLPPYPHPTVLQPLAQIRQPSSLNHINNQSQSRPQQRQRLHSDDNGSLPLKLCACFAPSRAWTYMQRDSTMKMSKRVVDSLFIMACHGNMIQYDLEPKPTSGIPKEKVCDNTMIELDVEAKGQWPLLRMPNSVEILPPLLSSSSLLNFPQSARSLKQLEDVEDRWLSQVEIVTHAGPHRRLWMGPQFVFKTYNAPSGVNLIESDAVEVGTSGSSRPARSNPVNMPHAATRTVIPVLTDGSGSSYEQSPRFMEAYEDSLEGESVPMGNGENQLREELAEAMLETSTVSNRIPGRRLVVERVGQPVTKVVNPLGTVITVLADEEDASSSQEFDDEPEYGSEAPKSVCAEEGPASLGDFDTEGNLLRDLTNICAEMRTTHELAFDNISYASIKDIKERKSLCVEVATMNPGEHAIDFERTDAFRDIPTSLSLCAEPGEIPHSPMTQAKESDRNKKTEKSRKSDLQEKRLTHAEYVVNCGDDSVVLIEDETTTTKATKHYQGSNSYSADQAPEQVSRKPGKHGVTFPMTKRVTITRIEPPSKYLLHEHEDSIVIEDTSMTMNDQGATVINSKAIDTSNVEEESTARNEKMMQSKCRHEMVAMEATVATACGVASLPLDLAIFDEINSMDYHIVEPNIFHSNNSTYAHQSDDDIEHIKTSDDIVALLDDHACGVDLYPNTVEDYDAPDTQQKDSSKSAMSDDDLEHIQTSELSELYEKARSLDMINNEGIQRGQKSSRLHAQLGISSDNEIEYLLHPDLTDVDRSLLKALPPSGYVKESSSMSDLTENKSSQIIGGSRVCRIQPRTSRKRKDVVIIDKGNEQDDEILVIVKPHAQEDNPIKSPSPEKDLIEEIDCRMDPKDWPVDVAISKNFPRKTRLRTVKVSASSFAHKASSNLVEIIDIDAMQKAELANANGSTIPECQVLEQNQDGTVAKMKKSRRNKDIGIGNEIIKTNTLEHNSHDRDEKSVTQRDWSPMVQKEHLGDNIEEKTIQKPFRSQAVAHKHVNENEIIGSKLTVCTEKKLSKKRTKKSYTSSNPSNFVRNEFDANTAHVGLGDTKGNLDETNISNARNTESEASHSFHPTSSIVTCVGKEINVEDNADIEVESSLIENNLSAGNTSVETSINCQEELISEPSISNDDPNANVVPMETEEDGGIRNVKKKSSITASPSWSTVGKKNNRSKKKKRR